MPTRPNYSVDKALTNVSIAYTNPDTSFIADQLFPRLSVDSETGIYFSFDKANLRAADDVRGPGSPANEVSYEVSQSTFGPLIDHALKTKVTDEEVRQTGNTPLQPFTDATEFLTEKMKINKEIDAVAKFAAASNSTTLSGTDQWSDYANSDPRGDIRTLYKDIKLRILRKPNTAVMGWDVYQTLLYHPQFVNILSYNVDKMLNSQKLADFMGVTNLYIGDAAYNTGVEGAADSIGYIWGKDFYLAYVEPNPGLKKMSAAYGFELTDGWTMSRWYDIDHESTYLRLKRYYQHAIVNGDAISRLHSAVA